MPKVWTNIFCQSLLEIKYFEFLINIDIFHLGLFKVAKADGGIFVRSSLAGKGRSEPYKITVRATDKGQIPQSNEVDLLIFVGDVATNDGVPQFIKPAIGEFASVYEVTSMIWSCINFFVNFLFLFFIFFF